MLSGVIHESRYHQLVKQTIDEVRWIFSCFRIILVLYQFSSLNVITQLLNQQREPFLIELPLAVGAEVEQLRKFQQVRTVHLHRLQVNLLVY